MDVFDSPRRNFRMRANFNIWHDNPKIRSPSGAFYAMFDETEKKCPCEIKGTYPFGKTSFRMNSFMNTQPSLAARCFLIS